MRTLIAVLLLGFPALAEDAPNISQITTDNDRICGALREADAECHEFMAEGTYLGKTTTFEIGPGGQLCGPARFILPTGDVVFELAAGKCLLKDDKK